MCILKGLGLVRIDAVEHRLCNRSACPKWHTRLKSLLLVHNFHSQFVALVNVAFNVV